MADSPAFNPPNLQPKDTDPMVIKVPMNETDWAARMGSQPPMKQDLPVSHVPNGR